MGGGNRSGGAVEGATPPGARPDGRAAGGVPCGLADPEPPPAASGFPNIALIPIKDPED